MAVKSADRVIQIFETIGSKKTGMTHGELAKALAIPKGSLSLLLSNLVDRDYLTFDQMSKLYMLGPKLLILTGSYLSNLNIVRVGRPVIHELVSEINEDTELAVMKGTEILFVHKEECLHPLKYSIEIGERAPVYATACGKAILAYLSEEDLARFFSAVPLISLTKNTITDPDKLRHELQDVRSKGLAYGKEEFQHGISAIAAPVFNFYGNVVGSVTVTIPSIRFNQKHNRLIESKVVSAAAKISRQLGFDSDTKEIQTDEREKDKL